MVQITIFIYSYWLSLIMKPLILSKNANITVKNSSLCIAGKQYALNELDFSDIFIDRINGFISFQALRMLKANGINIHFENYTGEIEYSLTTDNAINGKLKVAQIEALKRKDIPQSIIDSKIQTEREFLKALSNRYTVSAGYRIKAQGLAKEAEFASYYFSQLKVVFDTLAPDLNFQSRNTQVEKHNRKARDGINAMLNYAYTVLYAKVRKAISENGLMTDIGFVHKNYANKEALVYDLVEIYRWIGDLAVIKTLETSKVNSNMFAVSQLNSIRLKADLQSLIIGQLQLILNKFVQSEKYGNLKYETLIEKNTKAFAQSLLNNKLMTFDMPIDIGYTDKDIIDKLANMTVEERKALGIRKNTLWYIQQNIKKGKHPKLYAKLRAKLP